MISQSGHSPHFMEPEGSLLLVTTSRDFFRILSSVEPVHAYSSCFLKIPSLVACRSFANSNCSLRHVCPSVLMEALGSHWMDFYRILYMGVFRKCAEKIQVILKSDKKNGYFILTPIYIYTGYGLDGPVDQIPVGAKFSAPVQTGPGAHLASCTMGTGSFPGVKSGRGMTLTPHPF